MKELISLKTLMHVLLQPWPTALLSQLPAEQSAINAQLVP